MSVSARDVSEVEGSSIPLDLSDPEIFTGLKDVLEEAASIVVILRLWRVFKIVEEFSAGASDRQYILNLSPPDLYQKLCSKTCFESKKRFYPISIALKRC